MPSLILPKLPAKVPDFLSYLSSRSKHPVLETLQPYKAYEAELRKIFAQDLDNALLKDPHINLVPIFAGHESTLKIKARDLSSESESEKSRYLMSLRDKARKNEASPAIVQSLKAFQDNFNVFSESSLGELDWSNVVAAGSSVLTPLLPVPSEYASSKRGLRKYYHEIFTPNSDIDLFMYDLTEEQALEKIKNIERAIKDSILTETTTIRTKNAITIASQYPTRHIQIVLRIYSSVSEILTGFDVDCSCVAYDGKQVYATPRAVGALITQINHIDLTRRSPSYESRLSKYSKRGFEAYWSDLERDRIDPTIFERSFATTIGLARLLVLEKLPKDQDRENYRNKRRAERGRPLKYNISNRKLRGDIKQNAQDEVADWVYEDDVSNYHSFSIPYGLRYHAKRIEKLLYTKDLLLNAEWNAKDRKVNLHRHPCFFGDAEHIFDDCCGFCPKPSTPEEEKIAEEESKIYIKGKISFLTDNPGRQEVGSFNPITDTDWTEMAYVQNVEKLNQAISSQDLEAVKELLDVDKVDPNMRDYTGRTPLHLAVSTSSPKIVECLLNHGAYIIPRIATGENAMHLAALRGNVAIIELLDNKSNKNKAEALRREREEADGVDITEDLEDDDESVASEASGDTSNFVKIESCEKFFKDSNDDKGGGEKTKINIKDDVLDPNAATWDTSCTTAHIATVFGHTEALDFLLNQHGCDPNIPVKFKSEYSWQPNRATLSLVLPLDLPVKEKDQTVKLLIEAGGKCTQADLDGTTVLEAFIKRNSFDTIWKYDEKNAKSMLNYISFGGSNAWSPHAHTLLTNAIKARDIKVISHLLDLGAKVHINYEDWLLAFQAKFESQNANQLEKRYVQNIVQPVAVAVKNLLPKVVMKLIEYGADINTPNSAAHPKAEELEIYTDNYSIATTLLDEVREQIRLAEAHLKACQNETTTTRQAPSEPPHMDRDELYLNGYEPDSYLYWAMSTGLKNAKMINEKKWESYETNKNKFSKMKVDEKPMKAEIKAVEELLADFKELDSQLVKKGAKTYGELNPKKAALAEAQVEIKRREDELYHLRRNDRNNDIKKEDPETVSIDIKFSSCGQHLPESETAEYLQLFEAAWCNDEKKVIELTTTPRGENKDRPPLKISAHELCSAHNIFGIAMLKGYYDLAEKILSITLIQYKPEKKEFSYTMDDNSSERYSSENYSDNENTGDDEENADDYIPLYSRLPASIRSQFTIEDLGKVSMSVQSKFSPFDMIQNHGHCSTFDDRLDIIDKEEQCLSRSSVLEFSVLKNDRDLFNKTFKMMKNWHYITRKQGADLRKHFQINRLEFDMLLKYGRTDMIKDLIQETFAGVPLDQIARENQHIAQEQPKYYQGLSIRGKKYKGWAKSRHGTPEHDVRKLDEPPILIRAAGAGSIETFEWFMSDEPLKSYQAYANKNSEDQRLESFTKSKNGFDKELGNWLDCQAQFTLHYATTVLTDPANKENEPISDRGLQMISYLIKTFPESIELRTTQGCTPLQLAFYKRKFRFAKLLIDAGANVDTTDNKGQNLIHLLLLNRLINTNPSNNAQPSLDHEEIGKFLELLGKVKCQQLFQQRSKLNALDGGGQTPFHAWLKRVGASQLQNNDEHSSELSPVHKTWNLILNYCSGKEVLMIDGSGDIPLHSVILKPNRVFLTDMLAKQPHGLARENSVGRTPMELARDLFLADRLKPREPHRNKYYSYGRIADNQAFARKISEFVERDDGVVENSPEDIWRLCQEHVAKHSGGERQLCSLNEANEVAKRLAVVSDSQAGSGTETVDEFLDVRFRRNRPAMVLETSEKRDWTEGKL